MVNGHIRYFAIFYRVCPAKAWWNLKAITMPWLESDARSNATVYERDHKPQVGVVAFINFPSEVLATFRKFGERATAGIQHVD